MSMQSDIGLTNLAVDIGPTIQAIPTSAQIGLASTIPGTSNINSNVIQVNGFKAFSFSVTSTQAGTLTIKRYLDAAGTIPHGTDVTASLSANTLSVVTSNDGKPFQSIKINVSNSSGSTATLSTVMLLLQSQ
jgi:hypothetical protein